MREVKVLRSLEHDNIVRLLEVGRLQRKLFLVFEFVEGTILQVRLCHITPRSLTCCYLHIAEHII